MRGPQNSDDVESLRPKRGHLGKQKIRKIGRAARTLWFYTKSHGVRLGYRQVTGPLCFSIKPERPPFTGIPHAMVARSEPLYRKVAPMFPNLSTMTCAANAAPCRRVPQRTIHCTDKVMGRSAQGVREVCTCLNGR
jgi:hypothetical protein